MGNTLFHVKNLKNTLKQEEKRALIVIEFTCGAGKQVYRKVFDRNNESVSTPAQQALPAVECFQVQRVSLLHGGLPTIHLLALD